MIHEAVYPACNLIYIYYSFLFLPHVTVSRAFFTRLEKGHYTEHGGSRARSSADAHIPSTPIALKGEWQNCSTYGMTKVEKDEMTWITHFIISGFEMALCYGQEGRRRQTFSPHDKSGKIEANLWHWFCLWSSLGQWNTCSVDSLHVLRADYGLRGSSPTLYGLAAGIDTILYVYTTRSKQTSPECSATTTVNLSCPKLSRMKRSFIIYHICLTNSQWKLIWTLISKLLQHGCKNKKVCCGNIFIT